MNQLTQEVSLASYMAHELLLPEPIDEGPGMFVMEEDAHFLSIQINLMNTFLYMVLLILCISTSIFIMGLSPSKLRNFPTELKNGVM